VAAHTWAAKQGLAAAAPQWDPGPNATLSTADVAAQLALNLSSLRPGIVVADVIPNPPRTRLIRDAEARGCTVLDGLGMLVNQGAIGIKHWTGVDPDPTVMRNTLETLFRR